jgi:bifunctional phosphoglucose/phosphomannose isomerase
METVLPHTVEALTAQGAYVPDVVGGAPTFQYDRVLVCGMGGSRLPAHLIRGLIPSLDTDIHASYGLSNLNDNEIKRTHIIICSFSGETAEALDAYQRARKRGVTPSVITSGGRLLERAQADNAPHVHIPDIGIQPREAVILQTLGHLALLHKTEEIQSIRDGLALISSGTIEAEATDLLSFLGDKVPLLYGPSELEGLLRIYKVNFNETSRRPAFVGLLPEINHNEVEMFDGNENSKALTTNYAVLLFLAEGLDLRLTARGKLLADVLTERGVPVRTIRLEDWSWKSAVSAIALSMRIAGLLAERTLLADQPTALIQEFKQKMKPFEGHEA